MPDLPLLLALVAVALALGGLLGAVAYLQFTLPSRRRVRSLEAQVEHQARQLAAPRGADVRPLIDALPDPMILTDGQQRVTLLNAAASALLQVPSASAVGKPFVSVVTDQALFELFDAVCSAPESDERRLAQKELTLTRSGTHFVFQAVAVRNPGGAILLLLRDVTQLAAIVQMKTDFVSNAGHELRTPVAAIKVAFETLRDVLGDDPVQTEKCVGIISGHIHRLEEMLRDLLDLSRVESPDLQAQVREIAAEEAYSMVRATLGPVSREKGIDLVFEAPPGLHVRFNTDPRLLNLVLKNLVENSIKFTPAGGRITVTLSPTPDADSPPATLAEPPATLAEPPDMPGGFSLTVSDTGVGIAPEHQDRVFERFYQVDPARTGSATRGTGLGLAIVKHAVHALGGVVALDSVPGRGTTITCRFPPQAPQDE